MPLRIDHTIGNGRLAVWEITETEQELSGLVTSSDVESATGFRSESRRRERMAARAALRSFRLDGDIIYDRYNSPVLSTDADRTDRTGSAPHVSFSHTGRFACAVVSDSRCAVDIELCSRDMGKIADRFISADEAMMEASVDERFAVVVWCAKEALYKYHGRKNLDFIRDIRVSEVDFEDCRITASLCGRNYRLEFILHGELVVVYIL